MFLNTECVDAEHIKYIDKYPFFDRCFKHNIYYVRDNLDIGEHSTGDDEDFDMAMLPSSITQDGFLTLIVKTKSFRLAGGRVKCERLIKNNKLTYNIEIMGYLFAEIDCESREINKITNEFEFDKNKNEKFKEEVKQIANFIKENVFINHKPNDMTMAQQLISPLNEQKDYENWLEYMVEKGQPNRYIHKDFETKLQQKIAKDTFDLIFRNSPQNKPKIKNIKYKSVKSISYDGIGYEIKHYSGMPSYFFSNWETVAKATKGNYKHKALNCLDNSDDFMNYLERNFVKKEIDDQIMFEKA